MTAVTLPTILSGASSAQGGAGLNVSPGVAPSSPNNGDVWVTASGMFVRVNGGTVGPLNGAGGTGATTVSNSDGTLTISPTSGAVVASLALGHANTWSALQTFGTATVSTTYTAPDSATWTSSGILGGTSVVLGAASAQNFNGITSKLQLDGTTNALSNVGIGEWSNDGSVPSISFFKSRGTSIGSLGAVQANDNIGVIRGIADDGSTAGGLNAAQITFSEVLSPSSGSVTGAIFFWTRNGASSVANRMQIYHDGGVVIGATGTADEGIGTLNVQNNVYLNGSAYTNPDYVLEYWATGKIEKFLDKDGAKEYNGLQPLEAVEEFTKKNFVLPRIAEARDKAALTGHSTGLADGGDALMASLEEAYLYIFELKHQLDELKQEVKSLRG